MKPQAEIAHVAFWDVPFMLAASKNRSFRESQLLLAEAVAAVFTERGLCTSDWSDLFQKAPESFRVVIGDLTPEGFAFVPTFRRWLANVDRWTTPRTREQLTSSLRNLIDEHQGTSA